MMRKFDKVWLALLCWVSVSVYAEGWDLAIDRHQVQVWTGVQEDSAIKAFRARTVVHSSLAALVALFYDVAAAPDWIDHCQRVLALRRNEAQHSYVLLMETHMPWPLANRDTLMQGRWWQDPQTLVVHLEARDADPAFYPPRPSFIRTRQLRSDWTFRPLGHGLVEVSTEGHVDPRGHLPAWAINIVLQEAPYNTMRNLQSIIHEQRFQSVHVAGVREPQP